MGIGPPIAFLGLFCGLSMHVIGGVSLWLWASRVAKVRGGRYRAARALPVVGLLSGIVGLCLASALGIEAVGDVAYVAAAERSEWLSTALSDAMTVASVGAVVALLTYLMSAAISARKP